jgi:hypothetical protein
LQETALGYQLDLVTPGISPFKLSERKQIRHMENFLKYPRTLPQIKQRWYFLTANLGSRNAFAMSDFFATLLFLILF